MSFELPIQEWSTPVSEDKIGWANHTGSAGPASKREVQKKLFEEGPYAAIHYDGGYSMDAEKYDSGSSQIENLWTFTENTVPVLAKYSSVASSLTC